MLIVSTEYRLLDLKGGVMVQPCNLVASCYFGHIITIHNSNSAYVSNLTIQSIKCSLFERQQLDEFEMNEFKKVETKANLRFNFTH